MRKYLLSLAGYLLINSAGAFAQVSASAAKPGHDRVRLPNGWHLSPAGRSLPLGDLPLNLVLSASGKYMAATNNGQSVQSIQLIDPVNERLLDKVVIPKSWYGLCFSADEKSLYASGGNDNIIWQYAISNNKLVKTDSIILGEKWPVKISPAGISLHPKRNEMYVVTKENNQFYCIDLRTKKIIKSITLGGEGYACLLSPDQKSVFISVWGGAQVWQYNVELQRITRKIPVSKNPNELLLTSNGKFLFSANGDDNSVSVIDVQQGRVIEVLNTALYPDAPTGSASNGLALSANGKTLYVANADNNCLAVFDVTKPGASHSLGFIPTGWYPTNVKVKGSKIFVSNGKGFTSFANPRGPNPAVKKEKVKYQEGDEENASGVQYIGGLMKGTLSIIDVPNATQLAQYSRAVYQNTPYTKKGELESPGETGNPVPMKVGDPSPIKYVFYIIKENRTYDQVLGDIPEGNGDTSLVLFGEKITPNLHKLAKEFVLLDNFYVDGEVSADGHNWSLSANANDYLEKNWPTSYGGRGGSYDAEGNREIANPGKGFIWDYCKRAGVTYRTYGEFADDYQPNIPVLKNHLCPYYTSWDQSVRDTTRYNQWAREFDSMVLVNAVPQFNSLRIINDHTEGLSLGRPTPFAHCADNDWAVGLFVEHLSKSPIWNESVVFVVEDDAQNGPDHVDAHRSTTYVAGGYVKRHFVDHTMYSTSSLLRTIELILGLPPMSQYDAAAEPMWRCFAHQPNPSGFASVLPKIDITEKNTATTQSARISAGFDFSKEDRVPDLLFSEVIWKAVKGENSVMPAPRRSAFLQVKEEAEK
ncbi:bifunctional YncE family protein/alkaline phosphatase family protein [Flavihumibacter profundi]|uniref:bifunctional YncE family protein/alkaline phosphatase family protein n=1 Tax=Flavihumibacter profundi TaxID=2716883 RepID=UPI001CC72A9F|nr:bifunctional YncE family protein/alkaline phosphatase family protein [Flavihumibacter profundi]MBZ5857642.1 bifunctional YncE family protein/alkaline phosphatase family protein [Flavihumibacter profundi]